MLPCYEYLFVTLFLQLLLLECSAEIVLTGFVSYEVLVADIIPTLSTDHQDKLAFMFLKNQTAAI